MTVPLWYKFRDKILDSSFPSAFSNTRIRLSLQMPLFVVKVKCWQKAVCHKELFSV